MRILAIIPARGGSKGIANKNVKVIDGKPLIQYSIEASLESKILSEIWVSSDSDPILEIASKFKHITIHKRPGYLADDDSPISKTIEAIINLSRTKHDAILLLQPTAPIRTGTQIDEAIKLFIDHPEANSLISVCAVDDVHPARMYWKNDDTLESMIDKYEEYRRQDIPLAYYRNGSIYITRLKSFRRDLKIMIKPSIGYVMPSSQLLNIDEPRDILIAEPLIRAWKRGEL